MARNIVTRLILLGAIIIAIAFPFESEAIGIFMPFGGKVVSNTVPGVICPGEGPITIIPVGLSPATPFAVTPATRRYSFYTPTPGSWILGLYGPMAPICFIPATTFSPPIPVPAFPIIFFGTSRPGL